MMTTMLQQTCVTAMARLIRIQGASSFLPIFSDQDVQKGSHESFAILCPCTLSNSSSEWHEILRYNMCLEILFPFIQLTRERTGIKQYDCYQEIVNVLTTNKRV